MERPLVLIVVSFALGIALWNFWAPPAAVLLLLAVAVFLAALVGYHHGLTFIPVLLAACFLLTGWYWAGAAAERNRSRLDEDLQTYLDVVGLVVDYPSIYDDRVVYILRTRLLAQDDWEKTANENIRLTIYAGTTFKGTGNSIGSRAVPEVYRYGDILEVHGQLELPPTARNPGEFDYRQYLWRHGIKAQMLVSQESVRVTGHGATNPLLKLAYGAKEKVAGLIDASLPQREAQVLQALLFGDKERLDSQLKTTFSTLGLMHAFAVSGLHIGFLLFFLSRITTLIPFRGLSVVLLNLAGIWFYSAVTGFSPPVVRAALMASMAMAAPLLGRKADPYTSLAAAALLLLLLNPFRLFDAGFQFSFLAVLGILYLFPVLEQSLPGRIGRFLTIPLAAQLAVAPLSALYFNLLPLGGVLVNVLVIPLVGLVVILGLLVFAVGLFFPPLGGYLAIPAGALLKLILLLVEKLSVVPGIAARVGSPGTAGIIVYLLLVVLLREVFSKRHDSLWRYRCRIFWKKSFWPVVLVATILLMAVIVTRDVVETLEVTFLDVGQGDAIFINTPRGKTILIDGGGFRGEKSYGELVVVPFLQRQGIDKIDLVVSTHPDSDHIGGLLAVIRSMNVGLVVLPPLNPASTAGYREFLNLMIHERVAFQSVTASDEIYLDPGVMLSVLHPKILLQGTKSDDNNNSLVLRLDHGDISFLFTGDIEEEAMQVLAASGTSLTSTVFKVPHHGSKYGLDEVFLKMVNPAVVVIPVGLENSFGHPAPEIISYWEDRKIPVYRTDLSGAVTVMSDGRSIRIMTVMGERNKVE